MGWERKRGKLEEFNRLLLGEGTTSFLAAKIPQDVHFVITVDADTILPRDSIRKLVGTLAHPLNRPVVDPRTRHVVKGYGILQPRVSHTLTSANRSWFAKIVSGPSGIDPYTSAVSDLYQDLFKEASFVGKGIYDLKAIHDCLNGRFPENSLLSHDLIEGSYARTGLVTDVEIFDEHPSDYSSFMQRQHRWIRGDWQVSPWILPRVPASDGTRAPNTLSALNRWKLLDNLRRSLVPPALFLMLVSGWTFLPVSPFFWNLIVLGILFTRNLVEVTSGFILVTKSVSWIDHLKSHLRQSGLMTLHFLLRIAFLAHETFIYSDAIVRALYRMKNRKRLLEWV
ncbi:MAG TPA: glycosyltransferase family 2 protein, partial [Acidobacteriota bacterium]